MTQRILIMWAISRIVGSRVPMMSAWCAEYDVTGIEVGTSGVTVGWDGKLYHGSPNSGGKLDEAAIGSGVEFESPHDCQTQAASSGGDSANGGSW